MANVSERRQSVCLEAAEPGFEPVYSEIGNRAPITIAWKLHGNS